MKNRIMSPTELTTENVRELSEEDVSNLLNKLISDFPKTRRPFYISIISTMFDFRSISSNNRMLQGNLTVAGYKFFPIPYNSRLIWGIKRKLLKEESTKQIYISELN